MQIKRTLAFVDDVAIEAGQPVTPPLRKVAVVAVIDNPFAGRFEQDFSPLTKASEEIGRQICSLRGRAARARTSRRATARARSSALTASRSTASRC